MCQESKNIKKNISRLKNIAIKIKKKSNTTNNVYWNHDDIGK